MGKWGYIIGGVLTVGVAAFLYTPLPGHLEGWWRLQVFFAKYKMVFIWCEMKYRLGFAERIPAIRVGTASLMSSPLSQDDRDLLKIYDRKLNGVPVRIRIYQPKSTSGPMPGLVYIHGGAWMLFDIDMYDGVCAHIARTANIMVISVDYRLAPENPFPAGFNDCYKAVLFVLQNGGEMELDTKRVALGGDSGGGNLGAAVMLKLRDDEVVPPLKAHVSVYASLQFSNTYLPVHEVREKFGGKMIQIFTLFLGSYLNLTRSQMDLIDAQRYVTPRIKEKSDRLVDISLIPKAIIPEDYNPQSCEANTVTDDV